MGMEELRFCSSSQPDLIFIPSFMLHHPLMNTTILFQVANYCQERVHLALYEEIRNLGEASSATIGEDFQKKWERAFTKCFIKVDAEVDGRLERGSDTFHQNSCVAPANPVAPETVGSTAVAAVLCSSHIIVANCGDSRAVLCRSKRAFPLSVDHKVNQAHNFLHFPFS